MRRHVLGAQPQERPVPLPARGPPALRAPVQRAVPVLLLLEQEPLEREPPGQGPLEPRPEPSDLRRYMPRPRP